MEKQGDQFAETRSSLHPIQSCCCE